MDKDLFHQKTKDLLRYSRKQDRMILAKLQITETCRYCRKEVTNQKIECNAHRLGSPQQHFKHKCKTCNTFVYDGSIVNNPHALRKPVYNYIKIKDITYSPSGVRMGRPPKTAEAKVKRPVGRPRKTHTL